MTARAIPRTLVAVLLVLALGAAHAALTFPTLTGRVVDEAGIIPPDVEARLTEKLAALEASTTNQLVVVTLKSLGGTEIADYGYQLGRHWQIGQKGRNNGALLIVAPQERAVRIEVGYGLEGDLTDAVSRLIIENAIIPRFRAGDMPAGIEAGVDDIVKVVSGDAAAFKERAADRPANNEDWSDFIPVIFFLVIFIIIVISNIRRRRGRKGPWGWTAGPGWSSGSGWSGGSSGGGFSGGGGSFGGGGASGRW